MVQEGFGIGIKAELGAGSRRRQDCRWKALRDPGGRVGPPARAVSASGALGAGGAGAGARARRLLRHRDRLLGDRQHPGGMIAGFAGQDRPRRVIGIDASAKPAETLDQVTRIARQTASSSMWAASCHRGDRAGQPLPRGNLRDRRPADRGRHQVGSLAGGHDHRPGVRGKIAGRHDRSHRTPGDRAELTRLVRASRRPAGAERL